jgi:hypothetical protein
MRTIAAKKHKKRIKEMAESPGFGIWRLRATA